MAIRNFFRTGNKARTESAGIDATIVEQLLRADGRRHSFSDRHDLGPTQQSEDRGFLARQSVPQGHVSSEAYENGVFTLALVLFLTILGYAAFAEPGSVEGALQAQAFSLSAHPLNAIF